MNLLARLAACERAAALRPPAPRVPSARASAARDSLEAFVRHTMPDYEWNWHHLSIVRHLEKLERGEIKRLLVFAPPRSGKSQLVSRHYPAWVMGRNPDWQIIGGSHTSELAAEMCQDVQDIIDSVEYREAFPEIQLSGLANPGHRARRTQRLFDIAGRKGVYRGVGTRTRLSGHGMHLGILDDPIGDADEAFSPAYRHRVWNWYNSTFRSRKSQEARILVTLTRWHSDDLAGRLLAKAAEEARADQWTVLRFPALAEGEAERHPDDPRQEGEALWPARAGQFDLDGLMADKASMGSWLFSALMQQRPTAAEGARFKEEWFTGTPEAPRGYREEGVGYRLASGKFIPKANCWRVTVLDPAATDGKGSDWTAIGTFVVCPTGDILVLNMVRERLPLEKMIPRLKLECELYNPLYVGIESVGFQAAVLAEAKRAVRNTIKGLEPKGKQKLIRAFPAIARAEDGKIHLPLPRPAWARDFLDEVCQFTGNGDLHDDQVDCLAYAVIEAGEASEGQAMPMVLGEGRANR